MEKYIPGGRSEHVKNILEHCVSYLQENTTLVYQPVLSYLEKYGNLEGFHYETRPHGFGINYEWLVRCGIDERYRIPENDTSAHAKLIVITSCPISYQSTRRKAPPVRSYNGHAPYPLQSAPRSVQYFPQGYGLSVLCFSEYGRK